MEIYLDNSATTRPYKEVAETVADVMFNAYGNPSSLHRLGVEAEALIKQSRERIAATIKADPREIFFTSGGTESNNLAIMGVCRAKRGRHIIATPIEHPATMNTLGYMSENGYKVDYVPVDKDGKVKLKEFERLIRPDTVLVTAMMVNNEIGTIEPIADMISVLKRKNGGALFHVDAVQAYGKLPINLNILKADLMSLSSHKIHGPKGVGALYIRRGTKIAPIIFGGGQQGNIRPGTENVPGIAGFGLAAKLANNDLTAKANKMEQLKDRLLSGIKENVDNICVNTPAGQAPHILNVSFGGVRSEVLLHSLEMRDIFVSSGSACSSHKKGQSYVLTEIGTDKNMIDGSIRFSLSEFTTDEEIDTVIEELTKIVQRLRKLNI